MSEEIPAGFTTRTTSALPRRQAIDELHSKAEDLQRSRTHELNQIVYPVSGQKRFVTNNSNTKSGKKISQIGVTQQYNSGYSNPYQAATQNERLMKLVEERARSL